MVKKMIFGALVIGLLLLTGSCGYRRENPGQANHDEDITLSFMMPQSHAKDFLRMLLDEYEAENPGVKLEILRIPDNQWIDLVKSKAAVGEMPDLIRIDKGLLEEVGTAEFIRFDEETPWFNRVKQEQLVNKMIDGQLYGLPIGSTSSVGIVYNARLFAEHGLAVPGNIEELKAVCEVFRGTDIIPLYASDKDTWTIQIFFGCMAAQFTDRETWEKLFLNQLKWSAVPEYQEMLEVVKEFRQSGLTNPDYLEATYDGAVQDMADGKTAMYVSGQFFIQDVLKKNPDCELMMMPVPYRDLDILTIITGPGLFAVPKGSEHAEAAEAFLEWFSQPENMDRFNAGWSHLSVFKDQNLVLNDWQQVLYDRYIAPGRTAESFDETLSGINLNQFWHNQRELLAGRMSAGQVLAAWDEDFKEQMEDRQKPGWQ